MKRLDLIRHLEGHDCVLHRDQGKHTIYVNTVYVNTVNDQTTAVPRHREINDFLCLKICRDLRIPQP